MMTDCSASIRKFEFCESSGWQPLRRMVDNSNIPLHNLGFSNQRDLVDVAYKALHPTHFKFLDRSRAKDQERTNVSRYC